MGTIYLILFILLILSGFFSASEIALFSLNDTNIVNIKDEKQKSRISNLLDQPSKLLSTILISNNIVNILFANLLGIAIYNIFGDKGILLAVIIETTIILIFGEILPKTFASRFNIFFSKISSIILDYLINILKPFLFVTIKITSPIIKFILDKIPIDQEYLNKDEVLNVLKEDKGDDIDNIEETILLNILNAHLFSLNSVMKNIEEDIFIPYSSNLKKVKKHFYKSKSNFLIIYKNNYQNISGILTINNFYKYGSNWKKSINKPLFLPELKKLKECIEILEENQFALVVNEYGRVVGSVTYKDIMYYLIRNVDSQFDNISHERITHNSIIVDSNTSIDYINKILKLNLDNKKARTIGGYLQKITGRIPQQGETISKNNVKFFIVKGSKKRINKIKIYKLKDNND